MLSDECFGIVSHDVDILIVNIYQMCIHGFSDSARATYHQLVIFIDLICHDVKARTGLNSFEIREIFPYKFFAF